MQNFPFNPYYQSSHSPYFANAVQQTYGLQQPQQQAIQQTQPIQNGMNIIPVSAKEEATATPIDLVNGIPTFFYNKGQNEIYLKQFDVQTGTATLKTFIQTGHDSKPNVESKSDFDINTYQKDMDYLKAGIDGLYKIFSSKEDLSPEDIEEYTKPKTKKRG